MISPLPRAMVTSPHRLATEAGRDVLVTGSNAIEAAVATAAVLSVVYPYFSGIGGDAVWLVADREGRQQCFLCIGQATAASAGITSLPLRGIGSTITTAAAIDSWDRALRFAAAHWGETRLLARLLAPAIAYAEDCFPVSASQLHGLAMRKAEIASWPGFGAVHGDTAAAAGTPFRQPQLARTLRALAAEGARAFHEGELAERLATGLEAAGSSITPPISPQRTREVEPLALDFGDHDAARAAAATRMPRSRRLSGDAR